MPFRTSRCGLLTRDVARGNDARRALHLSGYANADSVPSMAGTTVRGGPIVSAGGLVFIAATSDNYLHAFDIESGSELWHGELPGRGKATPMTYRLAADGRQHVVIAVGGGALLGHGATLVAFALPQ